ncbi:glycosyltransferase family 8 protein [Leptodesmis sichuanensis]|uniref:glycosyltransferase family 8 protein n=1 Tax=Leptodesmis sichuanensis TaxID=2906798 RepID=UPI001F2056E2|nr:glycosyltransferase family 8 protein [Leptodesmis sichuanensis]UIE37512.1 glycosyltransferase family 8 protein [Leptodesmis sichuanensis A121]
MFDSQISQKKQLELPAANEPIFVVCAADNNYAMQLSVMARSVLANLRSSNRIVFFILDGGIKKDNKQKILRSLNSKNCEVKFIEQFSTPEMRSIQEIHKYCETEGATLHKGVISIATYYRLLLDRFLPDQIEKVIYLDCDLVVESDLMQLWQMDLGENYLAAVPDMWINSVSASNGLLNYQELGIPAHSKYFNAGVLLINLKRWRTDKITTKALTYLKQYKEYIRFHDQDVLNAVLAGQWKEIDPLWNQTPGIYEYPSWEDSPFPQDVYDKLVQNPYIIHFAASAKPWNSHDVHLKERFFRYVDMTQWAGWRFTALRQLQLKLVYKLQKLKKLVSK